MQRRRVAHLFEAADRLAALPLAPLTEAEVDELGQEGDADRLDSLSDMGLIRRSDTGWIRGVFS